MNFPGKHGSCTSGTSTPAAQKVPGGQVVGNCVPTVQKLPAGQTPEQVPLVRPVALPKYLVKHCLQDPWPGWSWNDPAGQSNRYPSKQRLPTGQLPQLPSAVPYWPSGQVVAHAAWPPPLKVPHAHGVRAPLPSQNEPAVHTSHAVRLVPSLSPPLV